MVVMHQDRLLTKAYRAKWEPLEDMTCPSCLNGEETTSHIMVQCPIAAQVWHLLGRMSDFDDRSSTTVPRRQTSATPGPNRSRHAKSLNFSPGIRDSLVPSRILA
ncbi:hypothetical protein QJS10_CPA08g00383 [Acorus calamus]|uniref:Reverse transcriptase zinc-binding domain-containing protein n=1 Tax=Acorus calamus TaxID=4465 RepID=A0AAV9EAC3_ACOCL|nr:hypothetical protein QJS10_CPA08g00383 [Acorus calamus]